MFVNLFDTIKTPASAHFPVSVVEAAVARDFFVRSQLPNEDLASVYGLADLDRDGRLSEREFAIAMKLVRCRTAGRGAVIVGRRFNIICVSRNSNSP